MQHCLVLILLIDTKVIFFIGIININLIKQRNQHKILYNISNYASNKGEEVLT